MKLDFSHPTFEKCSNIKFHENWLPEPNFISTDEQKKNEVSTRFSNFETSLITMYKLTREVNCRNQSEFATDWTRWTDM
jgi:hypothetical protein